MGSIWRAPLPRTTSSDPASTGWASFSEALATYVAISAIREADRISVLRDGEVIEEGTHEALVPLRER